MEPDDLLSRCAKARNLAATGLVSKIGLNKDTRSVEEEKEKGRREENQRRNRFKKMPQAGQFLVALIFTGVIISISIHKIDEGAYDRSTTNMQ